MAAPTETSLATIEAVVNDHQLDELMEQTAGSVAAVYRYWLANREAAHDSLVASTVRRQAHYKPGRPCVYVGMSGLTPGEPSDMHKAGIKSNKYVRHYKLRLMPALCGVYTRCLIKPRGKWRSSWPPDCPSIATGRGRAHPR